jgi:hypothetical protein
MRYAQALFLPSENKAQKKREKYVSNIYRKLRKYKRLNVEKAKEKANM